MQSSKSDHSVTGGSANQALHRIAAMMALQSASLRRVYHFVITAWREKENFARRNPYEVLE